MIEKRCQGSYTPGLVPRSTQLEVGTNPAEPESHPEPVDLKFAQPKAMPLTPAGSLIGRFPRKISPAGLKNLLA